MVIHDDLGVRAAMSSLKSLHLSRLRYREKDSGSDLYGCFWAGGRSQGPDNVEPGQQARGKEGAGQDDDIPPNHLQAGFSHGDPERSWGGEITSNQTPPSLWGQ